MATRSTIAMVYEDGTVRQIYCHWDGYPSHNGKILLDHYQNPEKVNKLMQLGNISSLGSSIEGGEGHSYENSLENETVFYGRDRGETGTDAMTYPSINDYKKDGNVEEYQYLFAEGTWFYCEGAIGDGEFNILKPEDCED
jgi:hypothetical protein